MRIIVAVVHRAFGAALGASLLVPVQAQAPPPRSATAIPPLQVEAPSQPASGYSREDRRDPFVSLVGRSSEARPGGDRPPGLPGILINEVNLKAIVLLREGYVAQVEGPDKKTYVVRAGQRLLDGSVKSIGGDSVVFSQDVNEPLSRVRHRDVKKTLRSSEKGQG